MSDDKDQPKPIDNNEYDIEKDESKNKKNDNKSDLDQESKNIENDLNKIDKDKIEKEKINEEYQKKEEEDKQKKLKYERKKKEEKEKIFNQYKEKRIDIKDIFIPKVKYDKENFYDIIIKINLINELLIDGWEIIYSKEKYKQNINKKLIPISVIGESNRGKSYLLGRICNIDLPIGFNEKTEGISVKYLSIGQSYCALIDSAGGQTPIIKDNKNNENVYYRALKYLILDKSITEQIIKDYILNKSRIIFVVIGQLTINEQLLINNLKIDNNYDEIIIIHNLLNFVKISQVKNYINDVLKKSIYFDLKEMSMKEIDGSLNKNQNNIYFIEKLNNNNNSQTIRHLIIANDSKQSEAGKYYNYSCINYLRNLVSVSNPKKFDIIEELKDFISEKSFNYIEKEKSDNKIPIEKDNFEIINDNNNNLKLVLKNINNLKLKRLVADESGNFKYFGNAFSPSFTYYKEFLNDIECFVIAIELAGKIKKLRQKISLMNNGKYFISITGIKELPFIHKNYLNYSDIDEDEFRIEFEINTDEYELKNTKYIKYIQSDGIIKLYYEIRNKNENSNEIVIEEKNNDKKKKKKKKNKEEKE